MDYARTLQAGADRLSWVILSAIVLFAPWIMGGRNDLGKCTYIALVSVYVFCFLIRQCAAKSGGYWPTGLEWLLFTAVAIVLFTSLPLGSDALSKLSPRTFELLPTRAASNEVPGELSAWQTLSFAPRATQLGLCVFVTHSMLFLTLAQRLNSLSSIETTLRIVASATLLMAVLALIQYLSGTDRFSFVFVHPSRDANRAVSGPFANTNHFSHFLAMGMGALIWWWQRTLPKQELGPTGNDFTLHSQRKKKGTAHLFLSIGMGLVVTAALLAASRGGMLALMISLGFCGVMLLAARIIRWPTVLALGMIALLVGVSLWIHGTDRVEEEFASLATTSLDELDETNGRRWIWAANFRAFKMFPIFGTGVGSHAEIYPCFFPNPSTVEYTHAESGYVHLLSENGLMGIGLLAMAIVTLIGWCARALWRAPSAEIGTCAMAASAGILVSLVHSVWDFVWYLTGTMTPAVILAACICRLARDHARPTRPRSCWHLPRSRWLAMTGVAAAGVGCMLALYLGPARAAVSWDRYKRLSLDAEKADRSGLVSETDAAPPQQIQRNRYGQLQQMAALLKRVLAADPHHYRAHLRMASVLQKAFEIQQQYQPNAMAISQIRDAAKVSDFSSDGEYAAWLERAVGSRITMLQAARAHLLAATSGLPFAGRAYIRLADLAFVPPALQLTTDALVRQAYQVRPYDAEILFVLGRDAAASGNGLGALAYWKTAYRQDRDYQVAITRSLATRMPVTAFVQQFKPDRRQLAELFRYYRAIGRDQEARQCAPLLAERFVAQAALESGSRAAELLIQAARYYRFAGELERMREMSREAVTSAPNDVDIRIAFANTLLASQDFDHAEREFVWCLRRRRESEEARRGLKIAQRSLARAASVNHE